MKVVNEIQITLIVLHILSSTCNKISDRILSFKTCEFDGECVENSFCHRNPPNAGQCICKDTFVLVYNTTTYKCVKVAEELDSSCIDHIQCEIGLGNLAECYSNRCKCSKGAHLGMDSKCHRTIALGGVCDTSNNCLLSDRTFAYCYVGKCICNTGYHISLDGQRCIRSSLLQESCDAHESCAVALSNCYGGICRCNPGYIETDDNLHCLKAASSIGDNCTQTIQCSEYVKGSFCDNNKCACKTGYHGYGNECVVDATLGNSCSANKECILTAELEGSVKCNDGICSCVEGTSNEQSYGCVIKNSAHKFYSIVYLVSVELLALLILY